MTSKTSTQKCPCDLCGETNAIEVPHSREYNFQSQPVHICCRCGLVYTQERRSAEAIAETWTKEIFGNSYTARIPAVKARQTYVADTLDVEIGLKDKIVCDIGGGEGQFLEIVRDQYGALVFSTEASETNCMRMSLAGVKHFIGTIEQFAASPDAELLRADIVTIMWTLECCNSPKDMLRAAHKVLKNDGYIAIATGSRLLVPFKKPLNLFFSDIRPRDTHPIDFSAQTLQAFLAVCGFETTFVNRYVDSDVLMIIAKKSETSQKVTYPCNCPKEVAAFFERWHTETTLINRK